MSENWKPGDVAIRTDGRGRETRGIVVDGCARHAISGPHWHYQNGGWNRLISTKATHRRLVVIDPENREEVERLDSLVDAGLAGKDWFWWSGPADAMQVALLEFANPAPPKPPEPTGLAAVVEDASGDMWIRTGYHGGWRRAGVHGRAAGPGRRYDEIAAVRVLSEGVEVDQ